MSSFSYLGDLGFSYKPLTFEKSHQSSTVSVQSLSPQVSVSLAELLLVPGPLLGLHAVLSSPLDSNIHFCNMPVLKGEPYNTRMHQVV